MVQLTNFWKDESAYGGAIILVITTVLMAYILFIAILPLSDILYDSYIVCMGLQDNQFYTPSMEARLASAQALVWNAPFGFITIGFVYAVVRTIRRQQYTQYNAPENK